ncbi:putative surface protease GP63 [Trypanosoma grayi]|uniref:putative surface protease GP63 n=1 Tax=Trypanosoma grayi TaxID=71804 RepID=UPI0004F41E38|nr:putative surface protease GP63 [Trypanosoma grayi]KEG09031.1 putative surface protease GP63 [Trypanosoma grayi]
MNIASRYCTAAGQTAPDFAGKTVVCEARDVLTADKKSIIVNRVLPAAVNMHVERLRVQPLTGNIIVPNFPGGICAEFTVPAGHHTAGVSGADMVLYAAAGPTEGSTLAWAVTCAQLRAGRPVVGAMNFGPQSVSASDYSVRVSTHEIAHALGFYDDMMMDRGMLSSVMNVRGKSGVLVVSSPTTMERARSHYNCPTAPGMELEDEGGEGTARSHWERRNAKDELMAGIAGAGYYTALTLAAFADMGFYQVAWDKAEKMSWGYNSGCDLLTKKCLNAGITAYPNMFCNDDNKNNAYCTSDRLALGSCLIVSYTEPLPEQYQYFVDPKISGPSRALMDLCPFIQPYSNTRCATGTPAVMPGSRIGPSSRCLKGDSLHDGVGSINDVCAEVSCSQDTVSVRYLGDDTWYPCPAGSSITPKKTFVRGRIVCPTYAEVCNVLVGEDSSDKGSEIQGSSTDGESGESNNRSDEETDVGIRSSFSVPIVLFSLVFFAAVAF